MNHTEPDRDGDFIEGTKSALAIEAVFAVVALLAAAALVNSHLILGAIL